jgi:hypothetical protein
MLKRLAIMVGVELATMVVGVLMVGCQILVLVLLVWWCLLSQSLQAGQFQTLS